MPSARSSTRRSAPVRPYPIEDSSDEEEPSSSPKHRRARPGDGSHNRTERDRNGCITCRLRRKKCTEPRPGSGCGTCSRLRIECLGYAERRPRWIQQDKTVVRDMKIDIRAHLARNAKKSTQETEELTFHKYYEDLEWSPDYGVPSSSASTSPYIEDSQDPGSMSPVTLPNDLTEEGFDNTDSDPNFSPESLISDILPLNDSQHKSSSFLPHPTHINAFLTPSRDPHYLDLPRSPSHLLLSPAASMHTLYGDDADFGDALDPWTATLRDVSLLDEYKPHGVLTNSAGFIDSFSQWRYEIDPSQCKTASLERFDKVADSLNGNRQDLLSTIRCITADYGIGADGTVPNEEARPQKSPEVYRLKAKQCLEAVAGHKCQSQGHCLVAILGVSYSLLGGGYTDWQGLLDVAYVWLQDKLSAPSLHLQQSSLFLAEWTTWIDILSSTSLGKVPKLLNAYDNLLTRKNEQGADLVGLQPMMGCDNQTMLGIAHISRLAEYKTEAQAKGMLDMMYLAEQAQAIAHTYLLSPVESPPSPLSLPSPPRSSASSPIETDPQSQLRVQMFFRAAAHVYLQSVVSGCFPSVPGVSIAVESSVKSLKRVEPSDADRALVWPICITGCLVASEEDKAYLRNRLRRVKDMECVGNVAQVLELMEDVWARRESQDPMSGDVDWRHVMQERGQVVLFV